MHTFIKIHNWSEPTSPTLARPLESIPYLVVRTFGSVTDSGHFTQARPTMLIIIMVSLLAGAEEWTGKVSYMCLHYPS